MFDLLSSGIPLIAKLQCVLWQCIDSINAEASEGLSWRRRLEAEDIFRWMKRTVGDYRGPFNSPAEHATSG
jgi:hypothetical protein